MILSDREIEAILTHGLIRIHPVPDRKLWTSTAIDLTLDVVQPRSQPACSLYDTGENGKPFEGMTS